MADEKKAILETLRFVYGALNEKGYNPISQLTGFLVTGDPSYITVHKNARSVLRNYDPDEYVEALLRYYFEK